MRDNRSISITAYCMNKLRKLWRSPSGRGGILFLLSGALTLASGLSKSNLEWYPKAELWDTLQILAGVGIILSGLVLLLHSDNGSGKTS